MRKHLRKKQEGAVAIMVALLMVFLLGVAALAIDIGNMLVARNEAQNAADATALAAAGCLYQHVDCNNVTTPVPDWTDAQSRGNSFVSSNSVQGTALKVADVSTGYWDITDTISGLQPSNIKPTSNDLPAVQVVIHKDGTDANKAVPAYLASVLGVNVLKVSAVATAVIANPGKVGPNGLFPMAMPLCMYQAYWNTPANAPYLDPNGPPLDPTQTETQTPGTPYVFDMGSVYHISSTCDSGQWTSFNPATNNCNSNQSDNCIGGMLSTGNPSAMSIGDQTWIKSGTADNLFKDTNTCSAAGNHTCEWETVPVVSTVTTSTTGAYSTIVAFACIHILSATNGSNPYVTMQMSNDPSHCQPPGASGVGPSYGAITPPRLVQ